MLFPDGSYDTLCSLEKRFNHIKPCKRAPTYLLRCGRTLKEHSLIGLCLRTLEKHISSSIIYIIYNIYNIQIQIPKQIFNNASFHGTPGGGGGGGGEAYHLSGG